MGPFLLAELEGEQAMTKAHLLGGAELIEKASDTGAKIRLNMRCVRSVGWTQRSVSTLLPPTLQSDSQ